MVGTNRTISRRNVGLYDFVLVGMRRGIVLVVLVVAGCTSGHKDVEPRGSTVPTTGTTKAVARALVTPVCGERNASAASPEHHPSERVWALVFSAARPSFRVGSLIKVVWRVEGSGTPTLLVVRPDGDLGDLEFGPDGPRSSSFKRPGDEYGSGFTPDASGCWQLSLRRGDNKASLLFLVEDAGRA